MSDDALSHADLERERSGDEASYQHKRSLQASDLGQFLFTTLGAMNRVQAQALAAAAEATPPVAVQVMATDQLVAALGHAITVLAVGESCEELKALQLQLMCARRRYERAVPR